jgi:hypothetical protein
MVRRKRAAASVRPAACRENHPSALERVAGRSALAERRAEGGRVAVLLLVRTRLEDDALVADDHDPPNVEQHRPLPRNRDVEISPTFWSD